MVKDKFVSQFEKFPRHFHAAPMRRRAAPAPQGGSAPGGVRDHRTKWSTLAMVTHTGSLTKGHYGFPG